MSDPGKFSLTVERIQGLEFEVEFDWDHLEPMIVDEPEPIGHRKGPNAARLLGAAVGNCLSASLVFCLEKAKIEIGGIKTKVNGFLERNDQGRWRVTRLDVHITLDAPGEKPQRTSRCIEIFEDYCMVTASVRKGIAVNVVVMDTEGNELLNQPAEGP